MTEQKAVLKQTPVVAPYYLAYCRNCELTDSSVTFIVKDRALVCPKCGSEAVNEIAAVLPATVSLCAPDCQGCEDEKRDPKGQHTHYLAADWEERDTAKALNAYFGPKSASPKPSGGAQACWVCGDDVERYANGLLYGNSTGISCPKRPAQGHCLGIDKGKLPAPSELGVVNGEASQPRSRQEPTVSDNPRSEAREDAFKVWWKEYMPVRSIGRHQDNFIQCAWAAWNAGLNSEKERAEKAEAEVARLLKYSNLCPEHLADARRGHMPSGPLCERCNLTRATTKRYRAEALLSESTAREAALKADLEQARTTNQKLNRENQAFLRKKIRDSHAHTWLPYWRAVRRWDENARVREAALRERVAELEREVKHGSC